MSNKIKRIALLAETEDGKTCLIYSENITGIISIEQSQEDTQMMAWYSYNNWNGIYQKPIATLSVSGITNYTYQPNNIDSLAMLHIIKQKIEGDKNADEELET